MEEKTTELLTSDFYRTLISVLIGGLISFLSILFIEIRKSFKEKRERKIRIYRGIISTMNIIRRYENRSLKNALLFNYHKKMHSIKNEEVHKVQAEYHQKLMDEYSLKVLEKTEFLDIYAIDYHSINNNDEKFQELLIKINNWERPEIPEYNNISSIQLINDKVKQDQKRIHQETIISFSNVINEIQPHMKTELGI